jgi:hypothetical protein
MHHINNFFSQFIVWICKNQREKKIHLAGQIIYFNVSRCNF